MTPALERLLAECDTAQKELDACHARFMEVSGDPTIDRDVVMEALGECHDARFRVSRVAPKLARIVRVLRDGLADELNEIADSAFALPTTCDADTEQHEQIHDAVNRLRRKLAEAERIAGEDEP